jgi:hypothetical protein
MIGFPNTTAYGTFTLCLSDVQTVLTKNQAGSSFSAVRKNDGTIWFCGTSGSVLGGSARYSQWENHTALFTASGLDPLNVKEINSYNNLKLNVVMNNGDLWCCGKNNVTAKSSFGTGTNNDSFGAFVKVPLSGVVTAHGNCYISGSTLYQTGTNSLYQYGNGTTNGGPGLTQIATDVVDVRTAWQGTYYLSSTGDAYGAGTPFNVSSYGNEFAQGASSSAIPFFKVLSSNVDSIESCMGNMSFHVLNDRMYSTGLNRSSVFGTGGGSNSTTFVAAAPATINTTGGRFVRGNNNGLLLVKDKLYKTGSNFGGGAANSVLTEIPLTFLQ